MAAGDESLLVGRGHDLARLQGREHGPQGNEPARRHHHQIHVRASGQHLEGVRPADELRAGGEIQPRGRPTIRQRHSGRPQQPRLLLEDLALRPGGQGHDSKCL